MYIYICIHIYICIQTRRAATEASLNTPAPWAGAVPQAATRALSLEELMQQVIELNRRIYIF